MSYTTLLSAATKNGNVAGVILLAPAVQCGRTEQVLEWNQVAGEIRNSGGLRSIECIVQLTYCWVILVYKAGTQEDKERRCNQSARGKRSF